MGLVASRTPRPRCCAGLGCCPSMRGRSCSAAPNGMWIGDYSRAFAFQNVEPGVWLESTSGSCRRHGEPAGDYWGAGHCGSGWMADTSARLTVTSPAAEPSVRTAWLIPLDGPQKLPVVVVPWSTDPARP